jgi:hypothetical protein
MDNFLTREWKGRDHHHHHHPRLVPCAPALLASICDIIRWFDGNFDNGVFALCNGSMSIIISCVDNQNGEERDREQHHLENGVVGMCQHPCWQLALKGNQWGWKMSF